MCTNRSYGNISLLLLLLFSIMVSKGASIEWAGPVTIHVQNDIQGNDVLHMHCRSNDDDLGQRMLHQGEEWHWSFRAIPGFTYFWCDFRWYDNWDHRWYNGTFDAYHANGLKNKYKKYSAENCPWSARRDGFYLYRGDKKEWQKRDVWRTE
ncbi:hypothetical protein MKW98_007176 [Papaver atlanticum]|uniref:S-protein homolog n=1 Tax=Papaver atlanticum TaxID=357466 RepID=A0AAD4SLI3_9MAGN|nr:hypothetical protein MKW98_007176 [Papaver atlanticum]